MILYLTKMPNGTLAPADQSAIDAIAKYKIGVMLSADVKQPRNVLFLRKYFALLNIAYEAFEPTAEHKGERVQKNFEQFREDVQILAGFGEIVPRLDGSCRVISKSIAFGSMSAEDFEQLYSKVIDVILSRILTKYTRQDLDQIVENILRFA